MANAFKCDRCGNLREGNSEGTLILEAKGRMLHLCAECVDLIVKLNFPTVYEELYVVHEPAILAPTDQPSETQPTG